MFPPGRWLNPADRPDWCAVAGAGRFAVPADGGRFERHHHDDDELWFISAGKARILVDGGHRYVQEGDIVLTRAGDTHDVVEVYESLRGFFVQTGHPAGGRPGHLYHDPADAGGHPVPARPVPADFPVR
ncbi:cupin domain-containing protein [Dactylosporangium sp. AC04546]|uniref:cupin domain-containing protein n=1 Tax=Dactylosporangium sp. AC04546 TaxID=2862460 RepID=UPI001EDE08C3|nr:cupin domain-containing protein [Dactylosporangium sp. AC04546]WVK87193.1 cupin domain-containing protein [Dactylosporangium sp. AC04546]